MRALPLSLPPIPSSLLHAFYSSLLNEAPSLVSHPNYTHESHLFCPPPSHTPSLTHSLSVLACLFVTKDNPAGLRLYEKAGYLPVQGDLKRKRFRPLLEAGAIHEDDLKGVVFMCKYIKPLLRRSGGGREERRQGEGK